MQLPDGRKCFKTGLAVLIQYRSVTASHPASHVAVAITLNANASSLKTDDIFRLACRRHSVYYLHPFSTLLCFVFCWDSYRAKTKPCFGDWRMCALCGCVFSCWIARKSIIDGFLSYFCFRSIWPIDFNSTSHVDNVVLPTSKVPGSTYDHPLY